jgi:hypothetical protein
MPWLISTNFVVTCSRWVRSVSCDATNPKCEILRSPDRGNYCYTAVSFTDYDHFLLKPSLLQALVESRRRRGGIRKRG